MRVGPSALSQVYVALPCVSVSRCSVRRVEIQDLASEFAQPTHLIGNSDSTIGVRLPSAD